MELIRRGAGSMRARGRSVRHMVRNPSAGVAAEYPAAPAHRAILAWLIIALLTCAWERADAARLRGAAMQSAKTAVERSRAAPKGPLQIIISIADQKISVYSGDALVARSEVSTGVPDHP